MAKYLEGDFDMHRLNCRMNRIWTYPQYNGILGRLWVGCGFAAGSRA